MYVAVTVQALLTLLYVFFVVQNMLRVVWGVQSVLGGTQSVSTSPDPYQNDHDPAMKKVQLCWK